MVRRRATSAVQSCLGRASPVAFAAVCTPSEAGPLGQRDADPLHQRRVTNELELVSVSGQSSSWAGVRGGALLRIEVSRAVPQPVPPSLRVGVFSGLLPGAVSFDLADSRFRAFHDPPEGSPRGGVGSPVTDAGGLASAAAVQDALVVAVKRDVTVGLLGRAAKRVHFPRGDGLVDGHGSEDVSVDRLRYAALGVHLHDHPTRPPDVRADPSVHTSPSKCLTSGTHGAKYQVSSWSRRGGGTSLRGLVRSPLVHKGSSREAALAPFLMSSVVYFVLST